MKKRYIFSILLISILALILCLSSVNSVYAVAKLTTPPTPQNLKIWGYSDTAIQIGWDYPESRPGISFFIYRNGFMYTRTPNTRYTFTKLKPSETYSFIVQAVNVYGMSSGYSNYVYQKTANPPGKSQPIPIPKK